MIFESLYICCTSTSKFSNEYLIASFKYIHPFYKLTNKQKVSIEKNHFYKVFIKLKCCQHTIKNNF